MNAVNEETDDKSKLYMTVLMTPDMANFSGNVHGGALLKLLDQVAYACAARYAETYVVTLSVDRVLFRDAIHVGDLVSFYSRIEKVGRTSITVHVEVVAERNPAAPVVVKVTEATLTFVAIDETGAKREVPPL